MSELCPPAVPPPLPVVIASQTLRDWGEHRLLRHLQQFSPATVTGDDAAVLRLPPALGAVPPVSPASAAVAQSALVVTTDVLIDGVHFSDRTTPPHAVGWRAVAANLSDLAAMGAVPWGITVGLGLPATTTVGWVDALYRGMQDCLVAFGGAIVGGDVCRSPVATVAITALGWPAVDPVWRRSTLRPGDWLVATGWHGASRAGLALLLDSVPADSVPPEQRQAWIQAHQYPRPRGDVVTAWRSLRAKGAIADPAIAAMDTSDGLADAAWQLCQTSGMSAVLWGDRLPQPPGLAAWVGTATAADWTLFGGEDFELLLGLSPQVAPTVLPHLGPDAVICGVATPPDATGPALYLQVIAPPEVTPGEAWSGAIDPSSRILYGARANGAGANDLGLNDTGLNDAGLNDGGSNNPGGLTDPRFQHFT